MFLQRNTIGFCIAYLLSAFGYEFILFVLTVHVYNLTGSALNVGIFMSLSFLARILSPFYGLITDRYDKRMILGRISFFMGCLIIMMGFINRIDWIYPLWFVASILAMMIMNVRSVIRVEIMGRDSHLSGNSLVLVILNSARIAAPIHRWPGCGFLECAIPFVSDRTDILLRRRRLLLL